MLRLSMFLLLFPTLAFAKPAAPVWSAPIAELTFGVFCTIQPTGQSEAPGTTSGFIHTIATAPSFDWPSQTTLPASIGLAFGVQARSAKGTAVPYAEVRVYRPGQTAPDFWTSDFSDTDPSFAFFRFDTEQELTPGLWVIEAWDGDNRLYRVEFDVVPYAQSPGIAQACGGTS